MAPSAEAVSLRWPLRALPYCRLLQLAVTGMALGQDQMAGRLVVVVEAVVSAVGYRSRINFYRTFRREVGAVPGDWQRQQRA